MLLLEKPKFTIVNRCSLFTIVRQFVVIGNIEVEILDEEIISRRGCFKRVRRWVKGAHPSLGVIIKGFTGLETVIEQNVIVPMGRFYVMDNPPNS